MSIEILTDDSQAVLLLCSTLALPRSTAAPKPLSRSEWNDLARAIGTSRFRRPGALLGASPHEVSKELHIPESLSHRITMLLERGAQLAIERERLLNRGIWTLTRADERYPAQLKERLKAFAPPVIFGAGPVEAVRRRGLAIVGSRDVDDAGAAFATALGERCARSRLTVISGAARGVDRLAMEAALEHGGTGVAVLADSLEDSLKRREVRGPVLEGRLTLLTRSHPSAKFTVAAAMGRNKLIYALASWAAVVSSGVDSGGTWAGAVENLEAGWVPLFVRADETAPEGNRQLITRGGRPLTLELLPDNLEAWLEDSSQGKNRMIAERSILREPNAPYTPAEQSYGSSTTPAAGDLFSVVWPFLERYLLEPRTEADVVKAFALERAQARAWLLRAVAEGKAQKVLRPVRFQSIIPLDTQKGLFDA